MAEAQASMNGKDFPPSFGKTKSKKKKSKPKSPTASTSRQPIVVKPVQEHRQKGFNSWDEFLFENELNAQWICGVEYFEHAPFGMKKWQEYARPGMVVEVPNYKKPSTYWPAIVHGFAGYKALVEYVKVNDRKERNCMTWVNFCSGTVKPLGYCFCNHILLYPPSKKDQQDFSPKLEETYKKLLNQNLPTVKPNHHKYCLEETESTATRFELNEVVEALDKLDCSRNRTGVISMTFGNRMHVQYLGLEEDDEGFWFSQQSEHVHKMGWSQAVKAEVVGANPNLIYPHPPTSELLEVPAGVRIERNAMFEMRHPVLLHKIVPAYVVEPLRYGYFLAATDWTRTDETVEIVMHVTSDYILPINFCRDHGIDLEVPMKDGEAIKKFSWKKFLPEVECTALDLSAIKKKASIFTKGCKLEAVNLTSPIYLWPATVLNVCGHLLRMHFDGFPRTQEDSFQWISTNSGDIYPAGYAQLVGSKLGNKPDRPNPADSFYLTTEPGTSTNV
ncbi:MBT domain-containing protein 1 [Orchesella cincta]|uniref:MBT domain-containing protein 1 n=1 Tax=Orchesella cincta TaxID=48709 RepID=A0A1D2N1C5_ORCCI|nr:MBT domain-containing protein 1 [Orchesella cincta]